MEQWDKIFKKHGKVFVDPDENMPRVIKLFKKRGVKRILDLGCGTGRHVIYFAKQGFEVYGVDISEEALKITRNWLKKERIRANLKIGSIYKKLSYKDNFFDAVISTHAFHHAKIEDIRKAIKELERVLKLGGLVFMIVRRRRLKKFRRNLNVTQEKYRGQKIDYKFIAPRTYVPIEGGEKGLVHYLFNKEVIRKEFKNFKIHNIWTNFTGRHYCFLGELKRLHESGIVPKK